MKSAILVKSGKALVIDEVELPQKLSFGQVLVDIKYSGICGSQINEIDATKGTDKYLPHLLGHEGSGVVERIGEGVTRIKKGDHVVLHWRKSSGVEAEAAKYNWKGKPVNSGKVTTFSEKSIVSENRLTVIPKNFDLRIAPLFGCAIPTGFGVVNNDAQVKIGQSVVIFGIGGVGLNIAQASKMVSANPIIGIDINEKKLRLGKKFGVTHGFLSKTKNLKDKIAKLIDPSGADVCIDTTGISSVIEEAYKLTNENGKTILVGVPNNKISIYSLPLHFKKILKGSHGGSAVPDVEIPRYIRLIKEKKMTLKNLITHQFNLSEINKAVSLFRSGNSGRIIIKMGK
jgi:S-(hydroxymethyl)glutathione dehydrogenase / alcohol dehydrogenase|tara:strand:+ start:1751 stop:2779 length:1029 start_codon:yes stop_codon:yes gene_type:complete